MEQEIKKKKGNNYSKQKIIYGSKEFLEKLEDYYHTYGNFTIVAKRLTEEYNMNVNRPTIVKLYKDNLAKRVGTDEKASKFFQDSFVRMQRRWEDAWEMIGDLVLEYKRIGRVIREKSPDELTRSLAFMKMLPQIISLADAIRKQLEFIGKQQEEIKVYQQNNLIISPVQIRQQMREVYTTMPSNEIQSYFESIDDDRFKKISKQVNKILASEDK